MKKIIARGDKPPPSMKEAKRPISRMLAIRLIEEGHQRGGFC